MPAYFSIEFQYNKQDLKETTVSDFVTGLLKYGLSFKSGFLDSENDTLENILSWNQNKLGHNFKLCHEEIYTNDYKQCLFDFYDFSEVRLYILNHIDSDVFSFCLIIPENDFIEYREYDGKSQIYERDDRMSIIENLAIYMWENSYMCCIQTGSECSECPVEIKEIDKGKEPLIEPFAIVPEKYYKENWDCNFEKVKREGYILRNVDNWLYI